MISVVVCNVGGDSIDLDMHSDSTVRALKDKLARHWSVPPKYQQLVHGASVLEDSDCLASRCASEAPALQVTMVVSLEVVRRELESGSFLRQVGTLASLGEVGQEGSGAALAFVCGLLEDESLRFAAVRALAALVPRGDPQALELVARRLGHAEELVREAAVEALSLVAARGDRPSLALLGGIAEDESPRVRRAALEALSRMAERGDAGAVAAAGARLGDAAADVRWAAVRALALLAGTGDEEVLGRIGICLSDCSWLVRHAAADALPHVSAHGDPEVVALLVKHLDDEDDCSVSAAIEDALARLSGPDGSDDTGSAD